MLDIKNLFKSPLVCLWIVFYQNVERERERERERESFVLSIHLSKTFGKFGNILIGLSLSFFVRPSFLKTEVTSADFISDRNLLIPIDLLNYLYRTGEKTSILSLIILVGI